MQRGPWWLIPLFAAILAVLSACTVGGEVSDPGETVTASDPATVESEPSATAGPLPTVQVHTTIQPTPQATETAISEPISALRRYGVKRPLTRSG
jgi:hypothetical protein